jgi:hypothetical protein
MNLRQITIHKSVSKGETTDMLAHTFSFMLEEMFNSATEYSQICWFCFEQGRLAMAIGKIYSCVCV